MARRGEANFVAVRIGFWNDPRILVLADELKVSVGEAGSFVVRWEELVLADGDARTGRVKGYSAKFIALAVGWKGKAEKLIAGLKSIGVLGSQRGVFVHPFWAETRTGQYAIWRAKDSERHRLEKNDASAFHGSSAEAPRNGGGGSVDEIRKSPINEERNSTEPAPQPPPGAGGGVGLTRWEWMLENHDRPRNREACVRYLEAMSDEDWALCQFAVTLRKKAGGAYIGRRKRVWLLASDDFLRKSAYLEFHRERQEKLRAPEAKQKAEVVDLRPGSGSDKFILAQLADPELTEADKDRIRAGWRAKHPNETPPWEIA